MLKEGKYVRDEESPFIPGSGIHHPKGERVKATLLAQKPDKNLLEEVQQKQKSASIVKEVDERVRAIAEAHNEGDKFIY